MVVIANESLVDATAIEQLNYVANLPGVVLAVGLPDLHAGASCPIGATIATNGLIYPSLVGSDIGCGMLLVETSLTSSSACKPRTLDRWAECIQLEEPWDGDYSCKLALDAFLTTLSAPTIMLSLDFQLRDTFFHNS